MQSGGASVFAGAPQAASHRLLGSVSAGGAFTVAGLAADEVVSVQSGGVFVFTATVSTTTATTVAPTTTATTVAPTTTATTVVPEAACTDPLTCGTVDAELVNWRCTIPGCGWDDWRGAAIGWPSWSAYSTNARSSYNSRETYTQDGELIHPYMGAWADGCEVTAQSGRVLIIEWQRGTDTWRETLLLPGQTHVINLIGLEDNAMIETDGSEYSRFSVSLRNCTPEPLPDI